MSNTTHQVAIALGANLGDRLASLRMAVEKLSLHVDITTRSCLYETAAAYVADQPIFLNAVIIGTTKLEPLPLLWMMKDLESEIGRAPTFRYGPRVIDLDILFYGDLVMETPELIIPHPRIQERDFVLRPLCDIAPEWRHPLFGTSAAEMLTALPEGDIKNLGAAW